MNLQQVRSLKDWLNQQMRSFLKIQNLNRILKKYIKLHTDPIPEESEEEASWNESGFQILRNIGLHSIGSTFDLKVKIWYSFPIRTPKGYVLKEYFVTDWSTKVPTKLVMWNCQAAKFSSLQPGDFIEVYNAYINSWYDEYDKIQITVNQWKSKVKICKRQNNESNIPVAQPLRSARQINLITTNFVGEPAAESPVSKFYSSPSRINQQICNMFTKCIIKEVIEITTYQGWPNCSTSIKSGSWRKWCRRVPQPTIYYLSTFIVTLVDLGTNIKWVAFKATADIIAIPVEQFTHYRESDIKASITGVEFDLKIKRPYKYNQKDYIIEEVQ